MEAKETAGLAMTKRVVWDCRSGLLETTSNRPWRRAKMNTHQLLRSEREREGRWESEIKRENKGEKMTGERGNVEAAGGS